MIGAIGTKLAYAMCLGCPVYEEIQEAFCHELKGQEALEKGNKCYLDELKKKGAIFMPNKDCVVCGRSITEEDRKESRKQFRHLFEQVDMLGEDSLTEHEQVLYNGDVHFFCYDWLT